ncbi:UNVERIFIED_CONTAM: lytic transglycosylase domain-containing protein, partial [Kocuria sp. CPCC 205274]
MAKQDYSDLVAKYAQKYGVPEKLVHQLISVESSGNANATSPTGPRGLMQVSRAVAEEAGYTRADMYDPEKNIDAGTRYLAQQLKAFKGNVPHALLGYNQGTGGARQMLSGKIPMAQEGYNYMRNKKFSEEYRSNDATLPIPQGAASQKAPATMDLIGMGKQAMQPQQ